MNNVTINNQKYGVDSNAPVKLNNGGLVLHYNKLGDCLGAYIITSYRGSQSSQTSTYYSLVNLDTGYIAFEERASRSTTIKRVLSHLNKGDYYGEQACKEGQYIEVYNVGNYKIDLQFNKERGQL